ncbi:hypothetical protein SAMIE_1027120 [Sphingobium amiense]|uniref:SMODS-associated and fused to various effectors domain-containing protein n=1 Tax=Sphingobium amiense TaxID=135719 RepID=A0A494W4S4_9SPHN|nr:SAVED domain-containing protein [Sphingobium amiense]BBD99211.1 hypothetical protein SAMIE_1027120 [Sphingobium amiense]
MLSDKPPAPALTDARGMGGVIAQGGFDYQLWDGLARLPAWLANPAFEEIIFEGLEDLEARFFAPQSPRHRLLERYQAKAGALSPSEVRDVLKTFHGFEERFPNATRVHALVTPRLPPTLAWLARDPLRVRRARPFYAPFADIMAASDAALRHSLVETYGLELGEFVASAVEVSERSLPDAATALATFGAALDQAFPALEAPSRRVADTFEVLSSLARHSLGTPLGRSDLRRAMEQALGKPLPLGQACALHIRSDRNEADETALELDASQFSGGDAGFPPPDIWAEKLLGPLDRAARWLRGHAISRVALSGSYRLSTALAVGWSLRSTQGFELEIQTRAGSWSTDDRPTTGEPAPPWRIQEPSRLEGDALIVAVGVLRDPSTDLEASAGIAAEAVLGLHIPEAIASGRAAQASVSLVKRTVDTAVARLGARRIRLYLAGPAAFAVALGHRWNAMPPTQLHEYVTSERHYEPTALL